MDRLSSDGLLIPPASSLARSPSLGGKMCSVNVRMAMLRFSATAILTRGDDGEQSRTEA